jgi:hypothetical protein
MLLAHRRIPDRHGTSAPVLFSPEASCCAAAALSTRHDSAATTSPPLPNRQPAADPEPDQPLSPHQRAAASRFIEASRDALGDALGDARPA